MTDIASFQFIDPARSFAGGFQQANALRVATADRQAGTALQDDDYRGASNALLGAGDVLTGLKVKAAGQDQALAQQKMSNQQRDEALKYTSTVASRLAQIHQSTVDASHPQGDVSRTLAQFDAVAPNFKKYGESDADIAQIRAQIAANPGDTLAALGAGAEKEYTLANGGDGFLGAFNPRTGALTTLHEARPKPLELDPKKNIYLPDDDPASSSIHSLPGATPAADAIANSAGADPDAVWKSIKTQESGGLAHPGSAVGPDTIYGNARGSTQLLMGTGEAMARKLGIAWNPAMLRGDTPAALAYQDKLGRAYFDEGLQKSGGDPAAAAAYYFGGPDPAQHGPKTKAYVQQVMARAGGAAPYEVASNGSVPGPPSAPAPIAGYHLIQTGAEKAKPEDDTSVDNNIVRGLIEGRITPPTQKAAATPYWQAQLQAATQTDPTFDGVNFQARQKTRNDFTSGKAADNIRALNTVVGHLDELDRSIDGLGNYEGFLGSHLNNALAQSIAGASNTDQRVKNFETAKTAVANELTRVFRGTGGAEADIQAWQKQLDAASGPTALHSVVKRMANLINSRVGALGDQYNAGMGTTHDPLTLLTPEKQKAFTRLMGDDAGGSSASAAPEILQARAAIAKGAPRAAVIQRLRDHNIDPAGL